MVSLWKARSDCALGEDRITCFPGAERLRVQRKFLCSLKLICPVQSCTKKHSA